jgi:hypothetical protein
MPTLSAHILRRGRWFRDQGHLQSLPKVSRFNLARADAIPAVLPATNLTRLPYCRKK